MLSISSLKPGNSAYYADLAREDYYTRGGEPPGRWWGEGARTLGLHDAVTEDHLHQLFAGFGPDGRPLVQNAGKASRQAALDLTFSAEKSVSVLWAFADEDARRAIVAAHEQAVETALGYLQQEAAYSRVGHGGTESVRAGMVVGMFRHETSRAQDPNLHTHCLVINLGVAEDEATRTLRTRDFYRHKMAAGALYRVQLAHELQKTLGVEIEQREKGFFRVVGVDERLRTAFSTRRQAIEQAMESWGMADAVSAERAALATRASKGHVDRDTLGYRWREHAELLECSWESVREIPPRSGPGRQAGLSDRDLSAEYRAATELLEHDQATFSERDVVRRLAERCVDGRTSAEDVLRAAGRLTQESRQTIAIAMDEEFPLYATRERCELEDSVFNRADRLVSRNAHRTGTPRQRETLDHEQSEALEYLTHGSGDLALLSGIAGSGKTRLLRSAREEWERAGYRVVGATLSGKAAGELRAGAGIDTETFEKRRRQIEPTWGEWAAHVGTQFKNAALKRWTYTMDRMHLDDNTVVVIDEAAMADTKQMEFFLRRADRAQAKVVLVGDERQLPAIEGASPFYALLKRHGGPELTTIYRQDEDWMKEVVRSFAGGDAASGLATLKAHDALHTARSKEDARRSLVEKWDRDRAPEAHDALVLAGTRRDVAALNELAQARRNSSGELGRSAVEIGDAKLFEGDRVVFNENHRRLGVSNGDFGTLRRVRSGGCRRAPTLQVDIDGRGRIEFTPDQYSHISLGYAVTSHKAQGATVDRAFVLFDDVMASREMAYVQVSRPKRQIEVFVSEPETPDLSLAEPLQRVSRCETAYETGLEYTGRERAR